jgi:hypothetical protein
MIEITSYYSDNPAQIKNVIHYIAVKRAASEMGEFNPLLDKLNPVLGELSKTAKVYQHGKSVAYSTNGRAEHVEHFNYGIKEGEEIYYDKAGNVLSSGNYSKDKKEGEWTIYFETDNKYYRKGFYENDQKHGVWGTYLENGTLVTEEKFIGGKLDENIESSTKVPTTNHDAKRKLRGLCGFVGEFTKESEPQGRYEYTYQIRILEAASVNINIDSEEMIANKVSKMWKENETTLICNNTRFDVGNGNIIKWGVILGFDHFVFDMARWKVNLNKVDEMDGRTVLDYVKYHLDRAKGTSMERKLDLYYNSLKSAGAKHKHEL